MNKDIEDKISDTHIFFTVIGRDLEEVLSNCSDEELYAFNAESYALYSAIFGECKIRGARNALEYKLKNDSLREYYKQTEKRLQFVSGLGEG